MNDAGVLFLGDIEEVLEQIDAGVAEHDIKAVELVISGLNERIDLRSVGDIANLAPAVISAEFLRDFFKKSIVPPSLTKRRAIARPMPVVPPVITATLPANLSEVDMKLHCLSVNKFLLKFCFSDWYFQKSYHGASVWGHSHRALLEHTLLVTLRHGHKFVKQDN